jgi:hypothetical protein
MQDISLVCTLDGIEYKEYDVLMNEQSLGIISWRKEPERSEGCWYTTVSDGSTRYFQTQAEIVEFLRDNPLKSASELSAKLKAEADNLYDIAEQIEAKNADVEAQDR